MAKKRPVAQVTEATQDSVRDDVDLRTRRYLWSMAIRTVCFVLAVVFTLWKPGWYVLVFFVGAVVLPWIAVSLANNRTRRTLPTRTAVVDGPPRHGLHGDVHPAAEAPSPPHTPTAGTGAGTEGDTGDDGTGDDGSGNDEEPIVLDGDDVTARSTSDPSTFSDAPGTMGTDAHPDGGDSGRASDSDSTDDFRTDSKDSTDR
ncbi:DUF3099 domain-containing protein [Brevibacterium litoralis]|uniref:DUF3099 domain-containing protein n=1 Tax=Brevibacterium litoralis TaxID=3138935 RepID=UPI0032F03B29